MNKIKGNPNRPMANLRTLLVLTAAVATVLSFSGTVFGPILQIRSPMIRWGYGAAVATTATLIVFGIILPAFCISILRRLGVEGFLAHVAIVLALFLLLCTAARDPLSFRAFCTGCLALLILVPSLAWFVTASGSKQISNKNTTLFVINYIKWYFQVVFGLLFLVYCMFLLRWILE